MGNACTSSGWKSAELNRSSNVCSYGAATLRSILLNADDSSAFGSHAGEFCTGGSNDLFGARAGSGLLAGSGNLFLSVDSGKNIVNTSNNICIQNEGVLLDDNTIRLGNNTHLKTFITGITDITLTPAVLNRIVVIDDKSQLGTIPNLLPVGYIDGLIISDNSSSVKNI